MSTSGELTAEASSRRSRAGEKRQRFGAAELAIVLSRYRLGPLDAVRDFPRGSSRAPKAIIRDTSKRLFLLKRRARGRDTLRRVGFCHAVQLHLARHDYPLPRLIPTRQKQTMLDWQGQVYELFEFVRGEQYDGSTQATGEAGRALGLMHRLLDGYEPENPEITPRGSYHAAKAVGTAMRQAPQTLRDTGLAPAEQEASVQRMIDFLEGVYDRAAEEVEGLGLAGWPEQVIHSDWHPGNMLFQGGQVAAVVDYDSARLQQRVIDAANGALQFSILGGGTDPADWPEKIDIDRFKHFLAGYESELPLSRAELAALPWLMIEALIAEAVVHVAASGSFARLSGVDCLRMVERKVKWLETHADHLVAAAEGAAPPKSG
ncbi:MAG: phosphotransferase enzyme family protein [Phycisphaeraceae bacterium]